jgi:hypothetical protein
MKRLSTAEPPERNNSTLMPVSFSKRLAMLCAAATGVEVYQRTLPSRLAAAMSTAEVASAARAEPATRHTARTSKTFVIVASLHRHCEERSDEAIQAPDALDCFRLATLGVAMTCLFGILRTLESAR